MHPKISRSKRQLKGTGETAVYSSKYYFCPKKARQDSCDGYVQHGIKRIEAVVLDEIYVYLDGIKVMDISSTISNCKARLLKEQSETARPIQQKIATLKKELARLEEEILKCLVGESEFAQKQLSEAMSHKTSMLSAMEHEFESAKERTTIAINRLDELTAFKKLVVSWKKEFAKANAETQKELIGKIIDRVHISRETVDITFKFSCYDIEEICSSKTIWQGGAPPACPVGSSCLGGDFFTPMGNNYGGGGCCGGGAPFIGNWLGSVCEIPLSQIVCFTHSAI
jgi:hypothetical protein